MKKSYLLIICFFFLLIMSSCKKDIYVIELEMDQAVIEYLDIPSTYQVEKNQTFGLPTFEPFSYITYQYHLDDEKYIILKKEHQVSFNGWIDNATQELLPSHITVTANINATLRQEETISTSTIVLNLNGGLISPADIDPEFDLNYQLPILVKDDYNFLGWCKNKNLTGEFVTTLDFTTPATYQLYAKYEVIIEKVIRLINELPAYQNLTANDIEQVEYIYNLYNYLSSAEKALVTNAATLIKAKDKCTSIKRVQNVIQLIDALPRFEQVMSTDKFKTDQILSLYNELTIDEQTQITNINKFNDIRRRAEELYETWSSVAKYYDDMVLRLSLNPSSTDKNIVQTCYRIYHNNSSTDNLVPLLKLTERIDLIYQNYQKLEKQSVEYIISTSSQMQKIVTSKAELFTAFFTDFYHYIMLYHGTEKLIANGITSLEDFLNLAKDPNGGGTTNHRGIGNIAGEYLLKKDINGVIENQPSSVFLGYCYKNNLYRDVINFFYNFFAYWRIDEKYANLTNYGADLFAEAWAPTVDIAKFFYYNEETSYVKTDRMIDCLTNVAGVVYGMNETFPTNLKLRGYRFEGWYLTSDYSGERVTTLPDTTNGKVTLYAKWEIDEGMQQKDLAAMTEIYIYNLTTSKAVVNSTTISYARNLYNQILENYAYLVTNYDQLVELENNH